MLLPCGLLRIVGDAMYVFAAVLPLKWWLIMVAISSVLRTFSSVAISVVEAEAMRLYAVHPSVDLVHINSSAGNRWTLASSLSSLFCICYVVHLTNCGDEAQPHFQGMLVAYIGLQVLDVLSVWKTSGLLSDLIERSKDEDWASSFQLLVEDTAADLQIATPSVGRNHSALSPSRRGRLTRPWLPWLKTCFMTAAYVGAEGAIYAALVTNLSDATDQMEPCSDRCVQFKMLGDSSSIPSTGLWPFVMRNGQSKDELTKTCETFGGSLCHQMPAAKCANSTAESCELLSVRTHVHNHLTGSKSEWGFVASIAAYSFLTFLNDSGLRLGCLGTPDAMMLQVTSTMAFASMTAFALMWASGAMELFFSQQASEPFVCGCYFRLGDVPSMLALALPLNLVVRLRTKIINSMRAAVVEVGYLSTVSFTLPYDFVRDAEIAKPGILVGARSLGYASASNPFQHTCQTSPSNNSNSAPPKGLISLRFAKRAAKNLCWVATLITLIPLLLSSNILVYRLADLALIFLKNMFGLELDGSSSGSLALFGMYSMIGLQAVVVGWFMAGTWTLYSILSIQLRDWEGGDLHRVKSQLVSAHPDMSWAFIEEKSICGGNETPIMELPNLGKKTGASSRDVANVNNTQ
eukprot:TRINITY_DN32362_c0_g1_i1.p1 TRINITY_DN32362_c0_g1~~TRINITY_DN32362_c0_g1_i1.p1  ORF type:complete len:633 (+),score=77.94 TRINITY_DN32362_c0_g1_i1:197-2095(+)